VSNGKGRNASGWTVIGSLAGLAVLASVGDFLEPSAHLRVHVAEIGERAQRPEVLAHISDGAFDFTFLPGCGNMAGARDEIILAGEGEEARVEPHQVAFMFGNCRGEIIKPQFACAAAQDLEGMHMAAHEGLETLAMRELQVHLAAVAFHQAEGVQLARRPVVAQGAEVSPIDVEAFARGWLHAHVSPAQHIVLTHGLQIVFEDRDAAVIAKRLQTLE
jgi:hypothetical protein